MKRAETQARDAEILRLMEVEQLRGRTIAKRLGLSETVVSRAWRRAMERRREAEEEAEESLYETLRVM